MVFATRISVETSPDRMQFTSVATESLE